MTSQIKGGRFGPVTQTDIVRFAGAGGDFNPLHHDPAAARQADFEAPIAMGQFTVALLSAWLTDQIGVENLRSLDVDFKAPVNIGDVINFTAELDVDGPDGTLSASIRTTVGDTTVVTGRTTFSAERATLAGGEGSDADHLLED
ncbi:Acyl dehydratase [Brevibacterium sandarakinum]|uniref:Acyl dehydratase n=1 Tax=Brevibacterium sandarakinum TaxID=629680 RepID=A0A1H1SLV4_BRESA|nr:MaoC family dehydratase [Brevibacterium sandarakinum]SDS48942.1 Acyl dehydratase [Brevibacterium sandarakinum]